jgi:hypothetical protein
MARVEELPDGFDESLNFNAAPTLDADDNALLEEMYYNRFAKKGVEKPAAYHKSFDEVMQELSQTPLFMNSLNDVADAGMRNISHLHATLANAEAYLQMART